MTNAIQVHGVRKNHAFNLHVKAFLKRNQETNSLLHHNMLYQKKNKFTIRNLEKKKTSLETGIIEFQISFAIC